MSLDRVSSDALIALSPSLVLPGAEIVLDGDLDSTAGGTRHLDGSTVMTPFST